MAIMIALCRIMMWFEPGRSLGTNDRVGEPGPFRKGKLMRFRLWPENGPDYHGLVPADGPANPKGVILLFHGNAGTAPDRFFYAQELGQLGYRLVLFEYPAHR